MSKKIEEALEQFKCELSKAMAFAMGEDAAYRVLASECVRVWAVDCTVRPDTPDFSVGLEWFNPLTDSYLVGTFGKGWTYEVRHFNGDGEDVSNFSDSACDEFSTLAGCMGYFVSDFLYEVRKAREVYEEGLHQQPK